MKETRTVVAATTIAGMPTPRELLRTCPHCSAYPAPFVVRQVYSTTGLEANERNWATAVCPACGGPVSLELGASGAVIAAYPEVIGEWEVAHLPDAIESDWAEAVQVFRVGAFRSAVVMCGRTLEAAADGLGIDGRNLQQRINKMLDQGLITASFREVMDYIRLIRNTGAHAGADVSRESARGTMRFTQQTLRLLFEVPGELNALTGHPPELDDAGGDQPE